jgi:hypothetical protein
MLNTVLLLPPQLPQLLQLLLLLLLLLQAKGYAKCFADWRSLYINSRSTTALFLLLLMLLLLL